MDPRSLDEQFKQRIAYVSENMNLPGWMTPQRAVKMSASIYPRWDASLAKTLLEEFNLQDVGPYSRLSKGQKRKICILLAICQNAELLVMDEPTFGLDVAARHDFLKHVLDVACLDGRTVFISSHLLSDLERIVDRIVVIDRGRLILQGDLEQLKAGLRQLHVPANVSRDELQQHFQVVRYKRPSPQETVVTVLDFEQERLHKLCAHHGWAQHARVFGLNLEDIFVELVKESCGQDRKEMEQ